MILAPPLAIGFLIPAFAVAGLALAGIPVLIHLLNRRRYRTVNWAAMNLLLRAVNRNRRRARFENWLLMAMRCLLLVFMGLALARPMGCGEQSAAAFGGRTGLHVLVIDNGLSMSYRAAGTGGKTHLDQAKILAGQIIDRLNSGGESVVIITAGKPAAGIITKPTYDLQQAKAIISSIPQLYESSDLPAALGMAIDAGRQQQSESDKHLDILTSGAANTWQGSNLTALQARGPELAGLFHISCFDLSQGPQWNQAVLDVHPSAGLITTNSQFGADCLASVKGFGDSHDGTLQWSMDGKLLAGGGKIHMDINTPWQIEPQTNLQQAIKSAGAHTITATIINDDPMQADNARTRVINVVSQLKTLIVEGRHGSGLNLKVALAGAEKSGQPDGFAAADLISDLELGNHILTDYRAVILCGLSQFTPTEADQLHSFVAGGGTLLIFMGEDILPESYNAVLLPRHLIPGPLIKRVIAADGKSFGFDFNPNGTLHPLLAAFAYQSDTGLETAQAFGYWQADVPNDPQMRVLNWRSDEKPSSAGAGSSGAGSSGAGSSGGASSGGASSGGASSLDPAITEHSLGQGRVVFISTAANEPWITFTRKPIYTELINELLSGSITQSDAWMNLQVGDRLVIPSSCKLTISPTLTDPKSAAVPLETTRSPDGAMTYASPPLVLPGVYMLGTGVNQLPIAVNIPPQASDVHTIDGSAIKSALGGIDLSMNDDQLPPQTAESSTHADWGWAVLLLVLGLTGIEPFCAKKFGHRQRGM
jgi:uncharacterized membrane protein YgcG